MFIIFVTFSNFSFQFATASVRHLPLCYAHILPDLIVTPVHNSIFTILPSDVARLQGFLRSKV